LCAPHARVEAGRVSAKTVNNARTWLAVVLNEAVRRRLMPRNPCKAVPPLRHVTPELDYLRIEEINGYLEACSTHYRPLAELLIGLGRGSPRRWRSLRRTSSYTRLICHSRRLPGSTM
jgi:hypothetical protein